MIFLMQCPQTCWKQRRHVHTHTRTIPLFFCYSDGCAASKLMKYVAWKIHIRPYFLHPLFIKSNKVDYWLKTFWFNLTLYITHTHIISVFFFCCQFRSDNTKNHKHKKAETKWEYRTRMQTHTRTHIKKRDVKSVIIHIEIHTLIKCQHAIDKLVVG